MMFKFTNTCLPLLVLLLASIGSVSSSGTQNRRLGQRKNLRKYRDLTVAGLLTELSGTGGFDNDREDFDLLLALVDAAGLTDALDGGLDDITVLAPNDKAFHRAAQEFGYTGDYNEETIFTYLANVVANVAPGTLEENLQFPIKYHLIDGAMRWQELSRSAGEELTTLCDCKITIKQRNNRELVVKDATEPHPVIIYKDSNYRVKGGNYVHTITRMMIPKI